MFSLHKPLSPLRRQYRGNWKEFVLSEISGETPAKGTANGQTGWTANNSPSHRANSRDGTPFQRLFHRHLQLGQFHAWYDGCSFCSVCPTLFKFLFSGLSCPTVKYWLKCITWFPKMGYPGSPSLDDICCKISFIDIFKSKKVRLNLTYLKVFFRGEGGAKLNDQIFCVRRHSFDYVFEYFLSFFFQEFCEILFVAHFMYAKWI